MFLDLLLTMSILINHDDLDAQYARCTFFQIYPPDWDVPVRGHPFCHANVGFLQFGVSVSVVTQISNIRHCKYDPMLLSTHYSNVTMRAMASHITCLTIVYPNSNSSADQRNHQISGSLAFVRGIHLSSVNSPYKGPVTRKMFQFDDVIMLNAVEMMDRFIQADRCHLGYLIRLFNPVNLRTVCKSLNADCLTLASSHRLM